MTDTPPFATPDLLAASAPEPVSPGRFALRVPDGWQQGRGAFGGIVLAALVRAIEASEPDEGRAVRSVNAEIAGPVLPGAALVDVTEVRRGKGLSAWNATLSQDGQGLVRCSAVLARARNTDPPALYLPLPSPPPWTEVPAMEMSPASGVPVFTQHMEFRPMGPLPFSGAREPLAEGWIRARHPLPSLGAAELVALADAWWPAAIVTAPAPRPLGTVAFAAQVFQPSPPLDPAAPLFYRGRVLADQDGYLAEHRELWSPDMRLVALNQQTIAWIR